MPTPNGLLPLYRVHDSKPSGAQLRYLRQLAERTGTTFAPPRPASRRARRSSVSDSVPALPASNDRQTARPPKSFDEPDRSTSPRSQARVLVGNPLDLTQGGYVGQVPVDFDERAFGDDADHGRSGDDFAVR
jgi:hypothetical protein